MPIDPNAQVTKYYDTLPKYTPIKFKAGDPKPKGKLLWGNNDNPPPPVGTVIKINFNGLGVATVTGYFSEFGWLGLTTKLHDAPDWHRRQNNGDPTALVFGPEFEVVSNE